MNKLRNTLDNVKENPVVAFIDIFIYRVAKNQILIFSASLAFFLILAIFPFLISLLNIVQFFDERLLAKILEAISLLPEDVASILRDFLLEIRTGSSVALLSISILGSVYSASSGVRQMVRHINRTYSFTEKRSFFSLSIISLLMTLALFIMVMLIFLLQIIGNNILMDVFSYFQVSTSTQQMVSTLVNLVPISFMFITFYLLYRFSPSWPKGMKIKRSFLLISAGFSTLGIIFTTHIFNLYLANFGNYSKTYGSIAGIIIFLIWLYLFGFIILLGGEINATLYQLKSGAPLWPREESLISGFIEKTKTL